MGSRKSKQHGDKSAHCGRMGRNLPLEIDQRIDRYGCRASHIKQRQPCRGGRTIQKKRTSEITQHGYTVGYETIASLIEPGIFDHTRLIESEYHRKREHTGDDKCYGHRGPQHSVGQYGQHRQKRCQHHAVSRHKQGREK